MKPSLDILRDRADKFLSELARAEHRYFVGRSTQLSITQLYAEFPELSDPETFAQLRELAQSAKEGGSNTLVPWLEFVATQVEEARAAAANEAIAALEASPVLPSIGLEPHLSAFESKLAGMFSRAWPPTANGSSGRPKTPIATP